MQTELKSEVWPFMAILKGEALHLYSGLGNNISPPTLINNYVSLVLLWRYSFTAL